MLLGSSSKVRPGPRHKPRTTGAELDSLPCCGGVDWVGEGGWICEVLRGFMVWSEEGEGDEESGQPGHVQVR